MAKNFISQVNGGLLGSTYQGYSHERLAIAFKSGPYLPMLRTKHKFQLQRSKRATRLNWAHARAMLDNQAEIELSSACL